MKMTGILAAMAAGMGIGQNGGGFSVKQTLDDFRPRYRHVTPTPSAVYKRRRKNKKRRAKVKRLKATEQTLRFADSARGYGFYAGGTG